MRKHFQSIVCRSAARLIHLVSLLLWLNTGLFAERLPVKTYTVADGLLRDSVYKIKQDSRGFLWFCTLEGISRFDGYSFRNFTVADGLPDRRVNDFIETRSGNIFIATDAGLAKLDPIGLSGSPDKPLFTTISIGDQKIRGFEALFEDKNETVWVGATDGLYKLRDGHVLEPVNLAGGDGESATLAVASIMADRFGAMWIGTTDGLRRVLPDGEVERFSLGEGLPGSNISVAHEDNEGRIWVGFRAGNRAGLVLLVRRPIEGQNIVERHFTETEGLPADWVTDLRQTSDGKFWIATTAGLCEWQGGANRICKTYTSAHDLCDRDVWSLTEDNDKNLWIGSRCGAKKWTRYGFTSYGEADGMGYMLADSIFENAAGDMFVSFNTGSNRMVSRFNGEAFDLVKPRFPRTAGYFGWGWKQTVWHDQVGYWWFPSGNGLFRFPRHTRFEDLDSISPEQIDVGAEGNEVFRVFEDSHLSMWIATIGLKNELWRWDRARDTWQDVTKQIGIGPDRVVTAFVEDRSGNLWIGSGSDYDNTALIRYRDGEFDMFTQAEYPILAGWLRDLYVDERSRLWIASTDTGLLRIDNLAGSQPQIASYSTAEGLSSTGVFCVTEDEFGRIYVGSGRGLDRLIPETGQVENFTTADGLPNSHVEVAFRDRKNTLWFGTGHGLARFDPEPERTREPPNILVTGVRVNGEVWPISIMGESVIADLDLTSDQRHVTIDFVGLGASLGEKLKYEYRLAGTEWTATGERVVNFANLDADSYRFEVRASTADRIYSQPATLTFRIAAPFWRRWWFALSLVAFAGIVIYGWYRYRLGRLLELERMRTRIATDLHDDIGSNLTRIALLSEVAKQRENGHDGAPSLLISIADIARESVASMNDIVWAISPKHDTLVDLTGRMRRHAEEVFSFRDIDLEFRAPASDAELKLSVSVRRDLLLVFKEAVNNVIKHSRCTGVCIVLSREDSRLKMLITDNGAGFDTAIETDGQGLKSMGRRTAALGGQLRIDSRVGEGTSIDVQLPLPALSRA